jgi:hypothetical protein
MREVDGLADMCEEDGEAMIQDLEQAGDAMGGPVAGGRQGSRSDISAKCVHFTCPRVAAHHQGYVFFSTHEVCLLITIAENFSA